MVVTNPRYSEEAISMHGIPVTEEAFEHLISVESPYRYELIDGVVYNMTGSSPEHADLAHNIAALLKEQLGKRNCSDLTSLIHSNHDRRRSAPTAERKPGTA